MVKKKKNNGRIVLNLMKVILKAKLTDRVIGDFFKKKIL